MSKCVLCNSKNRDPRCGDFINKRKIEVHEFCLYLSSALLTNGDEDNGLFGFLPKDIYAESKRVSKLHCAYCRKPYANIGCCKAKCQRSFHTLCGIENGCENQFAGTFRSYCHKHVHKHLRKLPPATELCCICYDTLRNDCVETPCCRNGWFHRVCLQGFAKTAGYFFKCPLCNDTKTFKEQMPYCGIFVPDRDAAWELEPNAFSELLERPSKCEAEICKHKKGRTAANDSRNPLVNCNSCGAVAVHQNCLLHGRDDFVCTVCSNVTHHASNEDSGHESWPVANQNENIDNHEEIDVCGISDSEDEVDFLEMPFLKREKCPILSDSSDIQISTKENSKTYCSQEPSSSEKRYNYESTEDSDSSCHILNANNYEKNTSTKVCNTDESDGSKGFINAEHQKSRNLVTDITDESNEPIVLKSRKNVSRVVDSTDEDSDYGESIVLKRRKKVNRIISRTDESNNSSSNSSECIAVKRQRIMSNKEGSQENANIDQLKKQANTEKPSYSKKVTTTSSYEAFSEPLKMNDKVTNINTSCIANRTRRKSIYLTEYEKNSNFESSASHNKKRDFLKERTSTLSSSSGTSLGYTSTESSTSSSSSSETNSSSGRYQPSVMVRRHGLQKSPSSSSLSSEGSSVATTSTSDSNSKSSSLNVSCIANRTRHRKSIYNSYQLQFINEESNDSGP